MDKTIFYAARRFRHSCYLLLALVTGLVTPGCRTTRPEVRVLVTGDILLSRNVREEIKTGRSAPWADLQSLFQSADLVLGNLEGAVGSRGDSLDPGSGSPVFVIGKPAIVMLREAGFNIITVENNHSGDMGTQGKANTMNELRNCHISPVCYENSPQFFTVKGTVIALLAVNMVPGRNVQGNQLPSTELKQKLRLARNLANTVIVSVHWGSELLEWPDRRQREAAFWLVHNGADLIIGSHPHVIQKPEMVEGKPVFFSLGNHLFDQKYPETKKGLIADIRIRKGKCTCSGIITHTKPDSFYPGISSYETYHLNPVPLYCKTVRLNGYSIRPVSVSDSTGNNLVLEAFRKGRRTWYTRPMPVVSIVAAKLDGKNEYLFMLERHFSSLDGETGLRPYVYGSDHNGLVAKWRGSGLSWPLADAVISPDDETVLCALHRGDSFISPDKTSLRTRVAAYRWNGFGFTGISDSTRCIPCIKLLGNEKE